MRLSSLRRIAAVSILLTFGRADGARRPHYGGELRVEMRAAPADAQSLDPWIFEGAVFETLVRLNDHGDFAPWLATSWSHDAGRKKWIFEPRAGVVLQNGVMWTPGPIEIADDKPIEEILRELARPKNAIVVRGEDGSAIGTGPFRVTSWETGKSATLAANDSYWGGRPFLDSIRVTMGRAPREQAIDLEVSAADVIESSLRPRGAAWASLPVDVVALQFRDGVPATVREALSLAIDRTAIYNVLLQKTGEISGALLPRWLTGYSFLFSVARDASRAKQMGAGAMLEFAYDRQDSLLRAIGERIAVNASEAGLTLRAGPHADVRLTVLPVTSRDSWTALEDLAELLKAPMTGATPYDAERALLADNRVVPLFHLPRIWAMNSRVHNWPRLADVWVEK